MMQDFESTTELQQTSKKKNSKKYIILAFCIAAVFLTIGVLAGYFGRGGCSGGEPGVNLGPDVPAKIIEDADPTVQTKIVEGMIAQNIEKNLREFTLYPHLGGTAGEDKLADEIYDRWMEQGMDHVTKVAYDVLLSYPDEQNPSTVQLINENGEVQFACQIKEKKLTVAEEGQEDIVLPFNAYSAPGIVEGNLTYVNYGTVEDFIYLNASMDLTGAIVIARYGKIFRADKVALAEKYGASAILLYTDPADYSIDGVDPYPNSWWLPETGVQRGTVFPDDGDPLTPGYPSIDSAYRWDEADTGLPQIPVHPISYGDALQLMKHMSGKEAPADWQGKMNITYMIGGSFNNIEWKVQMNMTTHNRRGNTTNVFGYIKGELEPDRYVILGNHRDAWVFGAVDPTSGTATMMELSRVLMDIVKQGWRPRRSIVFCSWGAEEYGLIGSYEWVENFPKNLAERTVAYLNVDLTISGNHTMRARSVPILYDLVYDIAKEIKSPNENSPTLYDEWYAAFPDETTKKPTIWNLGAASDYAAFMNFVGIPCVDIMYTPDSRWDISGYPLYHSAYETFYLVKNYIDPDFEYSKVIGIFWGEMARRLADSLLLPMNPKVYSEALARYVQELNLGYGDLMRRNDITLDDLSSATVMFEKSATAFHDAAANVNKHNPLEVRAYNDQLMLLERAFIDSEGLPLRPLYKHLIFAPSTHNAYAGTSFPGLVDLMFEIEGASDEAERWERVRRHLATIIFTIRSAAATLEPPTMFN